MLAKFFLGANFDQMPDGTANYLLRHRPIRQSLYSVIGESTS